MNFQKAFAKLFQALLSNNAQWWLVKLLNKEIPALADLLQTRQENINMLLHYANLGSIRLRNFLFSKQKFEHFHALHKLGDAVELNLRRTCGFTNPEICIQIGSKN